LSTGTRTVIVGFDALDFAYLDRFADSLPTFERLRDDGIEAPLESTVPPWTASAWPSMYTGTDPSYHGVYDFFNHERYPDETSVVTRNDVRRPAIWNYLSAEGDPSVVFNLPVTHPAEPIEGTLLPGYLAPEGAPGSPEGVRADLSDALGEPYRIYSQTEPGDDDGKLTGYLDLIDLRRRAAVELLSSCDWELAVVQVQKTDAVFHHYTDEIAFRRVYEAADEFLASVLAAVDDPVNVVVCSDHGIGRKQGYAIYLNEILRQHGYVEASSDAEERSVSTVKAELTRVSDDGDSDDHGGSRGLDRVAGGLRSALGAVGLTPMDVYAGAKRVGVGDALSTVVPEAIKGATAEVVVWRASRAYCRSNAELGVRINLEGREPAGTVPKNRYDAVREDIVDLLRDVETPDGRPAFESVVPREAVYEGPYAEAAPDVVVVPRGMNHIVRTKLYGRRFVPVDLYDHEQDGVFIAVGPDVGTDISLASLSLTDVAPVAMAAMGRPVPERTTGTVPDGVVTRPVRTADYGDVDFGTRPIADADGEDGVTERLEDLGYL